MHNVKVSALNNACVDVHDFIESNFVDITSETGQVTTQQIKTENLTIRTISGDVICQGTQVCLVQKRFFRFLLRHMNMFYC